LTVSQRPRDKAKLRLKGEWVGPFGMAKLILSRDVIFDESRGELEKEPSQTTIGWIREEPTISPTLLRDSYK